MGQSLGRLVLLLFLSGLPRVAHSADPDQRDGRVARGETPPRHSSQQGPILLMRPAEQARHIGPRVARGLVGNLRGRHPAPGGGMAQPCR